jgi:mono/diheme cytochrome c family protein
MRVNGSSVRWAVVVAAIAGVGAGAVASAQQAEVLTPKLVVTDYDMQKLTAPSKLSADEYAGKKLFVQRCAVCHSILGQPTVAVLGPWLDHTTIKRGETAVREKIMNGSPRMPGWRHTLAPPQIDQVVAYIKTVSPEDRPKPPGQVSVPID